MFTAFNCRALGRVSTSPGPLLFQFTRTPNVDTLVAVGDQQIFNQRRVYNERPISNSEVTMSVQLPPPTHRKRTLPQGELEAASTLKLGADQNTHTLSLSEARLVINKVLENKRRGGNKYEEPE